MKIECILKRQGGTVVDLGDKTYHFKPQVDGSHVADVADDEHVDKLLAISEAYREYHGEGDAGVAGDEGSSAVVAPTRTRKKSSATSEQSPTADQGE